jgi:hypothetical protein
LLQNYFLKSNLNWLNISQKKNSFNSSLSQSGNKSYPNHNDHEVDFHQCKIAMVSVLKDEMLSENLAEDVMGLVVCP